MIVLGIETSTPQVSCAIGGVEGVLASFRAAHGRRHAEVLTPAIDTVRRGAAIEMVQIRAVAVGIGPGLFTGLRVGVATAKAVAQALRVPMIGLSSLDLLAFPVRHSPRLIVAVIDARRGEVFTASYRHVPGGMQRVSGYELRHPDELASDLVARRDDALLVGDGALRYASAFAGIEGVEIGSAGTAFPSADSLVELAHPKFLREEFVHPSEVRPLYLRKADTAINWAMREGAA